MISNHFGDSVGGPEKAGVGGSIPSLATNIFNNLAIAKKRVKISRAYNTRTSIFQNSLGGWFTITHAVLLVPGDMLPRQHRIALRHLDTRVPQDLCELGQVSNTIRLDFVTCKYTSRQTTAGSNCRRGSLTNERELLLLQRDRRIDVARVERESHESQA